MQFINTLSRPDTMFGVCESLGQDLGISPNWIRIALAAVVIYNLEAALVVYAGLALLVVVSRLVYPNRKAAAAAKEAAPVATETAVIEAPKVLAKAA